MKLFFALLVMFVAIAFYEPSLLQALPIPKSEAYENKVIDRHIAKCREKAVKYVNGQVKDHMGLDQRDFQALITNNTFQENYCQCHGEIVRFTNLIPSDYLPTPLRKKVSRGIASQLRTHLRSKEGQEQIQYCFYTAWNKAAFSY